MADQRVQLGGKNIVERIRLALDNKDVSQIAANTFTSAYGNSDVMVLLELNGAPVVVLNLPFTLAKSLGENLSNTIAIIEQGLGHVIPTMDEMEQFRARIAAGGDS